MNKPHKIIESNGKEVWLSSEEYAEYKGLTNDLIYPEEYKSSEKKPFWKLW